MFEAITLYNLLIPVIEAKDNYRVTLVGSRTITIPEVRWIDDYIRVTSAPIEVSNSSSSYARQILTGGGGAGGSYIITWGTSD